MKVALVFKAGTRPHCCRTTSHLQLSLQDAPSEKSAGYEMHRVQVMHSALPAPVCYALYKTSLACTEQQPDILNSSMWYTHQLSHLPPSKAWAGV